MFERACSVFFLRENFADQFVCTGEHLARTNGNRQNSTVIVYRYWHFFCLQLTVQLSRLPCNKDLLRNNDSSYLTRFFYLSISPYGLTLQDHRVRRKNTRAEKQARENKTRSAILLKCQALRTSRAFSDLSISRYFERYSMFNVTLFHSVELVRFASYILSLSLSRWLFFSRGLSRFTGQSRFFIVDTRAYVGLRVLPQIRVAMIIILASCFKKDLP